MKIGFIGDVVGKPGREMIRDNLSGLRSDYDLDIIVVNGENASHGFGLSLKNAKELLACGVDIITGGNHMWDKKDIIPQMDNLPIVRPLNYPKTTPGVGVKIIDNLAVINLMGHFTMPMVANPFIAIEEKVKELASEGIRDIFIDFHAEATSEKNALFHLLKGKVSAICGTHTHVGTDDLVIDGGTFYVSDVGLTGCRDAVIGMDASAPLKRFLTGMPASYDIPKNCKRVLQIIIMDIFEGKCKEAMKIKIYNDTDKRVITKSLLES